MYFDVCRGSGTNHAPRPSDDCIDKRPLRQYGKTEGMVAKVMLGLPKKNKKHLAKGADTGTVLES